MKKMLMSGMLGLALLAGGTIATAEEHVMKRMDGAGSEFCAKHCNAMQLGKAVKELESRIAADKAELKSGGGAQKLTLLVSQKDQLKKHLAQHEQELSKVQAELDRAETELNQLGTK